MVAVIPEAVAEPGERPHDASLIKRIQDDGTCWAGSTIWQGHTAMRISVSSWATTEDDVDRSLAAILKAAAA